MLERALDRTHAAGITDDSTTRDRPPPLPRDLRAALAAGADGDAAALAVRRERYARRTQASSS